MVYQIETTPVQSPLNGGKVLGNQLGDHVSTKTAKQTGSSRNEVKREVKRRIAAAQARYDQQAKKIDGFLDEVGPDLLLDRFVDHLSLGRLLEGLDFLLSRRDVDLVEVVAKAAGSERTLQVLNKLAAPQHVVVAS